MLTGLTGLMLLIKLCKPLDIFKIRNNKEGKTYASQGIRTALFILMFVMFLIGLTVLKKWFSITITNDVMPLIYILSVVAVIIFLCLNFITKKIFVNSKKNSDI